MPDEPSKPPADRDKAGKFQPGCKPGPGRRRMPESVRAVLEAAADRCAEVLVEGLEAVKYVGLSAKEVPDQRERRECAMVIYERLYGRPVQEITGEDGEPLIPGAKDVNERLAAILAATTK